MCKSLQPYWNPVPARAGGEAMAADKSEHCDPGFQKPWQEGQDSHKNHVEQTKTILVSILRIKSYRGGTPSGVPCLRIKKS